MNVIQIECPHCHTFKVTTHVSTTKGRMRPDTSTFTSYTDYQAMMTRNTGFAFAVAIVVAIVLGFIAFNPPINAFHEPLDNAPITFMFIFIPAILSAVLTVVVLLYRQLGNTAFQRWKRVTQHISYNECLNCGKAWDYNKSYTDSWR